MAVEKEVYEPSERQRKVVLYTAKVVYVYSSREGMGNLFFHELGSRSSVRTANNVECVQRLLAK